MATNWAGNVSYTGRVHRPSSVAQLRELVATSRRVRALGSGHSFNRIADSAGELVSLDGLPPSIDVDTARSAVRVAAAVRYSRLAERLQAAGLALANLGSLPHLSIAGACATATHGSGDGNGNLATAVRALELVTAGGDLITIDRTTEGFDGAVVSLGMLGVVTALTLDTVPAFDVAQVVYPDLPHDRFDERIFAAAYSVSLFTTWTGPRFEQVWCKYAVPAEPAPPWPGAVPAGGPLHPIAGLPTIACTRQLGVPGPWHLRLPHFRPEHTPSSGDELQSEYWLPRARLVEAVAALHRIRGRIAPALQISELRTVAADGLWLSPAYQRDSATIHFTWLPDAGAVTGAIAAVEESLAPFDARPHWAKLFGSRGAAAASRYERLPDFRRLRAHYDPTGKFTNEFTDRLIGR